MENSYEKLRDYDFSLDSFERTRIEDFEKAAGGDAEAMYRLGRYYSNLFYERDRSTEDFEEKAESWDLKALYWYEKAAGQGHIYALCCIGHLYYDGNGFDSDLEKAAHWYRAAAERGNAEAQMWLGKLYQKGWGVAENKKRRRIGSRRPPSKATGLQPDTLAFATGGARESHRI